MASAQEDRSQLDRKAQEGQTVVPGGTGGKTLEAQEHLAEGRHKGGETRKQQLGTEGYKDMGRKGGQSTGKYEDEDAGVDAGDVPDDPEDVDYTPPAENTRSKA